MEKCSNYLKHVSLAIRYSCFVSKKLRPIQILYSYSFVKIIVINCGLPLLLNLQIQEALIIRGLGIWLFSFHRPENKKKLRITKKKYHFSFYFRPGVLSILVFQGSIISGIWPLRIARAKWKHRKRSIHFRSPSIFFTIYAHLI